MTHVVFSPCIGTKDTACVDVCPVDCIHPRKDEPEFEKMTILYIHPEECIDCGACIPACPVTAIYDGPDSTPSSQKDLIEANTVYRNGDADAMTKAMEACKDTACGAGGADYATCIGTKITEAVTAAAGAAAATP